MGSIVHQNNLKEGTLELLVKKNYKIIFSKEKIV